MILVDTSVWIDHIRQRPTQLAVWLADDRVLGHPFVLGELTLGGIAEPISSLLRELAPAIVAEDAEVLSFIAKNGLVGSGIGYIDAHLLVAVSLTRAAQFWTHDRALLAVAARLGIAATGFNA